MRPLTEEESKTLFAKLANYIGSNLVHLVDTPDDVSGRSLKSYQKVHASELTSSLAQSRPIIPFRKSLNPLIRL